MRGTGERAGFVSEQLGVNQIFTEGAAIDRNERTTPPAVRMYIARQQFLAGTGFTDDQCRRVSRRNLICQGQQGFGTRVVKNQGFRSDREGRNTRGRQRKKNAHNSQYLKNDGPPRRGRRGEINKDEKLLTQRCGKTYNHESDKTSCDRAYIYDWLQQ